jgi:hypothetical protein
MFCLDSMRTYKRSDNESESPRRVSRAGVVQPLNRSPLEGANSAKLQINVVFTDTQATRAALKRAVDFLIDLDAETRVIVPHVVPFPLPLDEPAVPLEFTCGQIQCLAGSVGADPYVEVYLCRDRIDLLLRVLPADSIVVIGSRNRWLPTKAERLARVLRKNGCDVIVERYG